MVHPFDLAYDKRAGFSLGRYLIREGSEPGKYLAGPKWWEVDFEVSSIDVVGPLELELERGFRVLSAELRHCPAPLIQATFNVRIWTNGRVSSPNQILLGP